jgi:hypothetical protein
MIDDSKKAVVNCPPDPLLIVNYRTSYVFESDFERGNDASGDAFSNQFRASYRIPFSGPEWGGYECSQWYLRIGADYSRFDFDHSGGLPIPNTLQSVSAVVAIEYLVNGQTAFILDTFPGAYFEHDINSGAFDAPTRMVGVVRLSDSFILVGGVSYAGLRSYPVIPIVGFQWTINDRWTLSLIPPDPKLIYKASDQCAFWVGAELNGGSFKTDNREVERKEKLSGAVVTYSEYRAGAGFTYSGETWRVELGGGYAFQRKFDFHRAEEGYETDEGAPYVGLEVRAQF